MKESRRFASYVDSWDNEKFCEKIFDTPLENIEKPYGIWMKAEPQRKNHTIGSKWLRQGAQIQGGGERPEMGVRSEKAVSVIGGADKGNSKFPGDKAVIFSNSNIQGGEKIGNDYAVVGDSNIKIGVQNSNINMEGDSIMNSGLVIMDPKRRRVDEIEHGGPSSEKGLEDVIMVEKQNNELQDQKNGLLAGAAEQARLGL